MKDPNRPEKWTTKEIEEDSAGYLDAQEAAREKRERAEQETRAQYQPEPDENTADEQARRYTRAETMRTI